MPMQSTGEREVGVSKINRDGNFARGNLQGCFERVMSTFLVVNKGEPQTRAWTWMDQRAQTLVAYLFSQKAFPRWGMNVPVVPFMLCPPSVK
ncbi:hypothetical protein BXT84_06130 [Sulfobacillus thermotolerans]|uniref:Uncharacterized protein n=1 Tax=Sulfobacillus thermotolerans TaxID=338644 RepID=A0ABN5GYG6_9FIRM|nr:hypothetical protein BXT84_06130 [Sulfobacillus thermotolerans]